MSDPWRVRSQAYLRFAVQDLLDQIKLHQNPDVSGPYPLELPAGYAGTAFERMALTFELSAFEQFALLLAAADELRPPDLRARCAYELGLDVRNPLQAYLSPYLLLNWCPDADPGAFRAGAPLLRGGLLRLLPPVDPTAGHNLRPLQMTSGAFEYLMGQGGLDSNLCVQSVTQSWIAHQREQVLCDRVVAALRTPATASEGRERRPPLAVNLYGDLESARRIGESVCAALGEQAHWACTLDLAQSRDQWAANLGEWLADWTREARLKPLALCVYVKLPVANATDGAPNGLSETRQLQDALTRLLHCAWCPVVVVTRDPLALKLERPVLSHEVNPPTSQEVRSLWAYLLKLPAQVLNAEEQRQLAQLSGHFVLPLPMMWQACQDVLAQGAPASHADKLVRTWEACRRVGRAKMAQVRSLAEHIPVEASWDDLVLPKADVAVLHDLVLHARYRAQVEDLYAARQPSGIVTLFSGPSGTGKTFAAGVVAKELDLDLFRVDLAQLSSKWIGETEKNLEKLFDAADEGGGVLLFDEADSVFGKRGDGGDANGRHANMQTNYLLQRLEAYRGLAILTTNLPSSIDSAFLRRIRFELSFREPGAEERRRLWIKAFPATLPTSFLDFDRLAQLKLTGANIKSAARHAIFVAVSQGSGLDQALVEQAVSREMRKLGRFVQGVGV